MLGKTVTVIVDRKRGSSHPNYPDLIYPLNYGYVQGVMAGDGEEQDAYIIGVNEPVDEFKGRVAAVIHRHNDIEDKWVVIPEGTSITKEEVRKQTLFQEQYYEIEIEMETETMQ